MNDMLESIVEMGVHQPNLKDSLSAVIAEGSNALVMIREERPLFHHGIPGTVMGKHRVIHAIPLAALNGSHEGIRMKNPNVVLYDKEVVHSIVHHGLQEPVLGSGDIGVLTPKELHPQGLQGAETVPVIKIGTVIADIKIGRIRGIFKNTFKALTESDRPVECSYPNANLQPTTP